jgi:cell division protein FtsN
MYTVLPYSRPAQSQRGGTFLGLLIGLLLGLGAALAVALYVSKVPVPFLNKAANKNTVDQDAQEAQKNKNWDPNEPLYGKTPAKVTATAVVGTATTATSANPETAASKPVIVPGLNKTTASTATPNPTVTQTLSAPKAASADPLGDLAKAKSAARTTAVGNSGADPFAYFIQAGAFRSNEDALAQKAKLALAGFEASITEREQSGRTVYRVRVGPLDGAGFETAMVRVQR